MIWTGWLTGKDPEVPVRKHQRSPKQKQAASSHRPSDKELQHSPAFILTVSIYRITTALKYMHVYIILFYSIYTAANHSSSRLRVLYIVKTYNNTIIYTIHGYMGIPSVSEHLYAEFLCKLSFCGGRELREMRTD